MLKAEDFSSIHAAIEQKLNKRGETLLLSKVIENNVDDKLIWVAECGDQPIPILAFDYNIRYYDTDAVGVVKEKVAKVEVKVPEKGDLVLIAMERGTRRLPRCVGKIQSQNFIVTSLDEA